jgi:hypothetical protein
VGLCGDKSAGSGETGKICPVCTIENKFNKIYLIPVSIFFIRFEEMNDNIRVYLMMKRNSIILAIALILTIAFMVAPVAADIGFTSISPSSGPIAGGTAVTITGTGIVSGSSLAVTIGNTAATGVTYVDATHITAITPAGTAGAKDVVITNGDGSSTTTGTGAFTYLAPPTFTSISPNSGSTSGGTAVTILGTNFVSGSLLALTIGGTAATGVTYVDATHITAITPAGTAGAKDVVITNGNGGSTTTGTSAFTYVALPTISTIIPSSGINNGYIRSVDVSGTGFATTGTTVWLSMSGQTNISMVNPSFTATDLIGDFNLNGATAGTWDVVVNSNGATITKSGAFTVVNASTVATVTSITPASGTTNTTVTITNLAGTGFQSAARMRLSRSGYNDVLGNVSTVSSTAITGTFDLTNQVPGTWTACVLYDGTNRVCGPSFTINAASSVVNGSIYFQSSPSGASVYLDNVLEGTTTYTLYNVTPGDHKVLIVQSGYQPYAATVTVTAGNQTSVYGNLATVVTATATTATPTPRIYTPVPTAKRTTVPVPTAWPSDTPTPASPVGPLAIIGAVGIAILVMRK